MALLQWGPALLLGVPDMDKEHQGLLLAMNRIHELSASKADKLTLDVAILRLVKLTEQHFADEERHMATIGYADLKRHALIHRDMLKKVGEHYVAFQKGNGTVPQAFFDFLTHWLSAHIRGIDRKYADHGKPVRV